MRKWHEGCLIGVCLVGMPTLAVSKPQATLSQDFLTAFQALDAACERKDIDGVLSHYAQDCTFIVMTPSLRKVPDVPDYKASYKFVYGRARHDLAWQRQELQQLFFVARQPLGPSISLPLQTITLTSTIQNSSVNRKATELRLTVKREVHLHQGQAQGIRTEVDDEVWDKGTQGWKLKRRTINQAGGWTDFS